MARRRVANDRVQRGRVIRVPSCPACGGYVHMKRDLKVRDVAGYDGVQEMYLLCPKCDHAISIYFMNAQLERMRQAYRRALSRATASGSTLLTQQAQAKEKRYVDRFNALQKEMREALGLPESAGIPMHDVEV